MFPFKTGYLLLLINITLMMMTGCSPKKPFRYDFEDETVLDALSWKCKTMLSLSDKHASSGRKCLMMELYPSPYPGITLYNYRQNWTQYETLLFDIYNPENMSIWLTVRIDDAKNPKYEDRYNHAFKLKSGMNHISVPLHSLLTSRKNRSLNLAKIEKILLFLVNPGKKRIIYLDHVRLE